MQCTSRWLTYHSFPHRCRQSSPRSGHTSTHAGCTFRLHTETLRLHKLRTSEERPGLNRTGPGLHLVHLCNRSTHHRACFWAGRPRPARRRKTQGCSCDRNPHRSRRHNRQHRYRRVLMICSVDCGRWTPLSHTCCGLSGYKVGR